MAKDNLKSQTASGLKWSLLGNYGAQIIGFVSSIVLARLLSPEDFGLVGMALTLINILRILVTLGMNEAIIQNKNISTTTASSVFYFNLGTGIVVGGLIALSAPLVAQFYGIDKLAMLVRLSALIYVLSSLNVVQRALLNKTLKFKKLTTISLIAQFGASAVAIAMALSGFGYESLMAQYVLSSILNTVLLWRASTWKPTREFKWSEIQRLWSFAIYSFIGTSLNKAITEVYNIVIAKVFSPNILGFYSRADSFSKLIVQNSAITFRTVLFPVLSKLQDQPERFKSTYIRTYHMVIAVSVYLTAVALISGETVIIALFGEKWRESVHIFQFLMFRGISLPQSSIAITGILAAGKAKENFNFGHVRRTIGLLPLITLYWGDLQLFMTATICTQIVGMVLNAYVNWKVLNVGLRQQLVPMLSLVAFSGALWFALNNWLVMQNNLVETAVHTLIFSSLYLGAFFTFAPTAARDAFGQVKAFVLRRLKRAQ